jgi:hypothetical protein
MFQFSRCSTSSFLLPILRVYQGATSGGTAGGLQPAMKWPMSACMPRPIASRRNFSQRKSPNSWGKTDCGTPALL